MQTTQVSAEAPSLPLSQGEFDEPIGLPLIVVCQNVPPLPCFLIVGGQNGYVGARNGLQGRVIRFHPTISTDNPTET